MQRASQWRSAPLGYWLRLCPLHRGIISASCQSFNPFTSVCSWSYSCSGLSSPYPFCSWLNSQHSGVCALKVFVVITKPSASTVPTNVIVTLLCHCLHQLDPTYSGKIVSYVWGRQRLQIALLFILEAFYEIHLNCYLTVQFFIDSIEQLKYLFALQDSPNPWLSVFGVSTNPEQLQLGSYHSNQASRWRACPRQESKPL